MRSPLHLQGAGVRGPPDLQGAGVRFPPDRPYVSCLCCGPTSGGGDRERQRVRGNPVILRMEEYPSGEEISFNADETSNIVKECVDNIIGGVDYNHSKINQWTAAVVEQSLMHLVKMGKPFKYIVTCAIMQKSGAGLHTASSCYWDSNTDGSCTVRWENRTMYCVISVFAVSIML
ncbi:dynein light chain Tctex-type 1-like [Stegostoma tigrinum]|uniref:dynein light chain Tctex-type 1-like n=1 Tax=Stegostoma tigrinum TaxID=3053191 RepID=UPI00202ACFF6|nr:dynein light chain Tctex-type 1-like [Stegostoma tigrinum]